MFFATILQRKRLSGSCSTPRTQTGLLRPKLTRPPAVMTSAALLAGTYRPPCACAPANGPVPCDAAILAVLSAEPITGCPNASDRGQ